MTRLRSAWAELKSRAFPPGAVTFHLGAWSRGALSEEEGAAARALLEEVGAERLLVLHGSAIRLRGETVVVVGPPAIGKSTACRALVLREGATWLEDGLVVAAESRGCWTLIETGTLAVLRHAALFAAGPRRFLGRPDGREPGGAGRGSEVGTRLHRFLDRQAFRAGVLLAGRQTEASARRQLPIDRIVVIDDPRATQPSWETDGRKMAPLFDVAARAPSGVAVLRCPTVASRTEAWRHLALALGSERAGPSSASLLGGIRKP
ncbi:hypothetical protein BAC2_00142 [uncultured bacterium]|nr:hypothetical protein BAC2_00142 [uncultured bacterium]